MNKAALEPLLQHIIDYQLSAGQLNNPIEKGSELVLKIGIRPIMIKNQQMYQVSLHEKSRVLHQNVHPEECAHLIADKIPQVYKQGFFSTQGGTYHVLVNKRKEMTVLHKSNSQGDAAALSSSVLSLSHNRKKRYLLEEGAPVAFLVELGIMTPSGAVVAKKFDKFRQINRFLEMVDDVLGHLPEQNKELDALDIVDFGCGKAYLTFALYHYLHHIKGYRCNILGLDLKRDVIESCKSLAARLDYRGLEFAVGDIHHHEPRGKVDMVISLHACNTATDAALEKAVRWDAKVILCVPCCQHELYSQVDNQEMASLLKYGILKERFAALVTDAARAELLTMCGYEVQILEFIDLEHTPKNLLIRAVKQAAPSSIGHRHSKERYDKLSASLNIHPHLYHLCKDLF